MNKDSNNKQAIIDSINRFRLELSYNPNNFGAEINIMALETVLKQIEIKEIAQELICCGWLRENEKKEVESINNDLEAIKKFIDYRLENELLHMNINEEPPFRRYLARLKERIAKLDK